ncbi:Zn-ribbon domain-containing OB-fold protein [Chloroflexota bacterium]
MTDQKSRFHEQKIDPAFKDLVRLPELSSEKPRLVGMHCTACNQYSLGNRIVCPRCFSDSLEETTLSRQATLYSFTITRLAPLGFAVPFAIGLVDLPEGLRIWSLLVMDSETSLKIGMEMELVIGTIRKDESGDDILGFKFKPVVSPAS